MRRLLALAVALAALAGSSVHAQGSGVMTHGSCASAMGAAGVAAPCDDGSAVLFNPAGLAGAPTVLTVGWTGITTGGSFTYDATGETVERERGTTSVPFFYGAYRASPRLSVGAGVFAPYGLGIDWPVCTVDEVNAGTCTGPNFEGRFASYDASLTNLYVQPTVAYQATPWLSVGAGVDVVLADIEINQRLDLAEQAAPGAPPGTTFAALGVPSGTDFADASIAGSGTGFGVHVGARAQLSPRLRVGARYLSAVEIDYDGDAAFTQVNTGVVLPNGAPVDALLAGQFAAGAPLSTQDVKTGLTLPPQVVVGVGVDATDRLLLVGDYQWTGWSSFDEAPIDFAVGPDQTLVLDYRDAHTVRLGGAFDATDALVLRAGFIYNTAATRDYSVSPLLPEATRTYYTLGAGYRLMPGLGIDVGVQLIDQADRRGRVRGRAPGLTEAELEVLNVGVYSSTASVVNVTLSYRLDER